MIDQTQSCCQKYVYSLLLNINKESKEEREESIEIYVYYIYKSERWIKHINKVYRKYTHK